MDRSANLKEKILFNIHFYHLLEDPTRMRLVLLLFLYSRLSLTQISELIHLTKPAVTHQLKKFIDIGLITISKYPVQGSITANYYELVPDFFEKTDIKPDPRIKMTSDQAKEIEILQFRGVKELYKLASNIFMHFFEFYTNLEEKAQKIKEPFGIHQPPIHLQIFPLSNEAYQTYIQKMQKITREILKEIKEENKNAIVERPMMFISTMFPLKDYLSSRDSS